MFKPSCCLSWELGSYFEASLCSQHEIAHVVAADSKSLEKTAVLKTYVFPKLTDDIPDGRRIRVIIDVRVHKVGHDDAAVKCLQCNLLSCSVNFRLPPYLRTSSAGNPLNQPSNR